MSDRPVTKSEIDGSPEGIAQTIILWRIYDVLLLLLACQSPEMAAHVGAAHERGTFIGPNPSFSATETENEHE